jgi:hypothetical protein
MANPANSLVQNLLPVQAYFSVDGVFQTFIGQGQPFYATANPSQSGLNITNSTIDSTTIGATTPSTGVFTNIATTTGTITTQPSGANDIVNYLALQSYAVGISWKAPVTAATTVNITLSGTQTVDTVVLVAGNTVLVKNQTNSAENGIYKVNAGAWTYATGCTTWEQYVSALVFVEYGAQQGSAWYCTAQPGGTLGVTAMTWSNFSAAANYTAGTGLTLSGFQFSITPVGTAATYGSASAVPVFVTNSSGQVTSVTNTNIAIAGSQITSGTIDTARLSGSYTGITGVGTLTAGTWNASTIGVAYGGTGATTLTGYVKGAGTVALTASSTIPTTDLSGTISNAQLANSTISGVSLGSNLFSLTIGSGLSGTSYNGSSAVTITNSSPMTYPASGIPSSTGSAWNSSYSTTGSGSVLALATGATLNSPIVSDYETFTASSAPTYASGRLWYDTTLKALSYNNDVTNNTIHLGQETQLKVYNNTGSTIAKGAPVYITSTTSGFTYPLIALAKADAQTTGNAIGLTNEAIATGSEGYVVINGILNGVNTSSYTVGDILYVSPYSAGQLMNTYPPTAYAVKIGVVAYANASGSIYVNQSNAYVVSNGIIGTVAIANGGTNGTATPTAGAVPYGTGTAYAFTTAGTTGQVLTSNGASAPTWATLAYATVTDDTTTNATRYPLFASATSGNLTTEYVSSTKLQFNPSTGIMTVTGIASPAITNQLATTIRETATVSATAATGTINFDTLTQVVLYYTTSASGNFTLNFRGTSGTSLDTVMSTGQSLSATFLVTNGSTAYYNSAVTIDGNSVTPKWQGGSAPTSGNASSVDSYTYVILKTGSATFTVLASQTKFA